MSDVYLFVSVLSCFGFLFYVLLHVFYLLWHFLNVSFILDIQSSSNGHENCFSNVNGDPEMFLRHMLFQMLNKEKQLV